MPANVTSPTLRFEADEATSRLFAKSGSFKRRVLRLVLRERSAVRWILSIACFEAALGLAGPWLSAHVIDTALPDQASNLLGIVVALVIVAALYTSWAGWLHEKVLAALVTRLEALSLNLVLERFLESEYRLSSRRDFGGMQETMSAVSGTSAALIHAVVDVAAQALSTALMLGLLAMWFPALALAVVVGGMLMLAAASAYAFKEGKLAKTTLDTSSRQRQTLHVLLQAAATLRVFGITDRAVGDWRRQLLDHTRASVNQQGANVSREVVLQAFPQLLSLAATAWFVTSVMSGDATLGQMMLGVMLMTHVMTQWVTLATTGVAFQAMRPHFQRVDDLLADSEVSASVTAPVSAKFAGDDALVLDRVWFRYEEQGHWVLENYSRRFLAHRFSELRAASGAGKTTILRLLSGLVQPERGSVRVLGKDPSRTRNLVTYLPQRSVLLEASIATNLRVLSGRPLEEALRVAQHTGLAQLLDRLPMGIETVISVAGGNLSAGQRQLVLLTAAFASGRPVVLLDEATSQLDTESKRRIDWEALTKDKTVILVRHD